MLNTNARAARAPKTIPMEGLDSTPVPLDDEGAGLDFVLSDDGLSDGVLPDGALVEESTVNKEPP